MIISFRYHGQYAGAWLLSHGAVLVVIDGWPRLSFQISSLFSSAHRSFPSGKSNQSNWSYHNYYLAFHFSLVLTFGKALPSTFRTQLAVCASALFRPVAYRALLTTYHF